MKRFNYSIHIDASPEKVFETVTNKSVYPQWAAAWGEGMDYSGSWEKGDHIAFHDQSQGGTKALVEDRKENEFIKLKHIAMVYTQAQEIPLTDDMMKKWIGSLEQYFFHPERGRNKTGSHYGNRRSLSRDDGRSLAKGSSSSQGALRTSIITGASQ